MNICICEFIIIYYIIIDFFIYGVVYGYIILIVCIIKVDFYNFFWKVCVNWFMFYILIDFEMVIN